MIVTILRGVMVLALYGLGAMVIGLALTPGIFLFMKLVIWTEPLSEWLRALCFGLGIAGGFFVFGISLLVIVGLLNMVLNLKLKEGRFGFHDAELFKWFFLNALVQGVKAFFMDFMLLTPFASLFYRMMGAKLGRHVQINSKNVADISLLEIGDNSVIGGNATVIGHVFERQTLNLKKIKIGANVVVGLNSMIMPGVEIGDGAIIAAGAVVPKNMKVAPKTVFRGTERDSGSVSTH